MASVKNAVDIPAAAATGVVLTAATAADATAAVEGAVADKKMILKTRNVNVSDIEEYVEPMRSTTYRAWVVPSLVMIAAGLVVCVADQLRRKRESSFEMAGGLDESDDYAKKKKGVGHWQPRSKAAWMF